MSLDNLYGYGRGEAGLMGLTVEPKSCDAFVRWRDYFRHLPQMWCVRHLPSGLVWANNAAFDFLKFTHRLERWDVAMRWVVAEDVEKVENAHSTALKTGATPVFYLRARVELNRTITVMNAVAATRCNCERGCALILIRIIAPGEEDYSD